MIVTYEDKARYKVAAQRYVHAIDALRLCRQYPLSYESRSRTLDDFVIDQNGTIKL